MNWWTRLRRRDRLERELDAELRFHVDEETDRLAAAGLPRDEARRRALAAFGGIEPTKEAARDVRGTRWVDDTLHDVRYAARSMRRYPLFTLAAVLSLAIGIGANTAIFDVLHALLLRPLDVPAPAELSSLARTGPGADQNRPAANRRFSYDALQRYRRALDPLHASVSAMTSGTRMQLAAGAGDDGAELVLGQLVTGDWFTTVGVGAERGRLLTPNDDAVVGGGAVAVLSDAYWTRRFGRDPSVVGSSIRLNGYPLTVVGVAAAPFDGFIVGERIDVWVPTSVQQQVHYAVNADSTDADISRPWRTQDGIAWLTLVARVPAPATRVAATTAVDVSFRHDLEALASKIADPRRRAFVLGTHVAFVDGSRGLSDLRGQFGPAVLVLMATVALVLLVACANLANLLMARGAARSRELALRLSLGARRGRLVRQLLTESLVLAALGGVVSILFARAGSGALLRMASDGPAPLPLDVSFGPALAAFVLAISIGTGVLFGLLPALRLSRADLHEAMKSSGHGTAPAGRLPFGRLLVVAQVALSFVLLAGAVFFVRTLHNLLTIDPGFEARRLVTARFDPRMAGYTPKTMSSLRVRLLDAVRAIPGADAAGVAMCGTMADCHSVVDIDVPGRQRGVGDDADVQEDYVNDGYFQALGMTFLAGRNFVASDTETSPHVAIVNEAMARHFFGDLNAVGRTFTDGTDKIEVVGIVRDSRVNGLREPSPRMAFYPYSQHPGVPVRNLYARVAGNVTAATAALRAAVRQADRNIAVREVVTLAELEDRTVARERLVSSLTGAFGLLAVAVACIGLYAMVAYSVTRRTNEIGIRIALGASHANVCWLVVRETVALVAIGTLAGVAAALPALRYAGGLLYGVSTHDPATLAWSAFALAAVGIIAGAAPAWRAARLDPAIALRID